MPSLKHHALTAATVLVAAIWFVALRPGALGGPVTYVIVHGVSMTGTLASGDLVVATGQDRYSIGDIVAYRIPDGPGKGDIIVHRIVGVDARGYATKGDANPYPDPWHPATSDVAGKLAVRVPGFGQIFMLARNPFTFGAIWALVAFFLAFALVRGPIRWTYSRVAVLDHWPLALAERPTWVTQTVYRTDERESGARVVQVWSRRDRAWVDLIGSDEGEGKGIWFGAEAIDFGDPMIVEVTPAEADAYIALKSA